MITLETLQKAGRGKINVENALVCVNVVNTYVKFGLQEPVRGVHYFAQLMHESGEFKYDHEIWGPTPAQKRYDTRTDLGNTPAVDGDGKLFMGRTPIQVTGGANYTGFTNWCREQFPDMKVPNFYKDPEAILTAPWEGLAPVWYWSTRHLNDYADANNIEMITRKINGGLNGYDDRLSYYTRIGLVVLGYAPTDVKAFQKSAKLVADNIAGPATRRAIHRELLEL